MSCPRCHSESDLLEACLCAPPSAEGKPVAVTSASARAEWKPEMQRKLQAYRELRSKRRGDAAQAQAYAPPAPESPGRVIPFPSVAGGHPTLEQLADPVIAPPRSLAPPPPPVRPQIAVALVPAAARDAVMPAFAPEPRLADPAARPQPVVYEEAIRAATADPAACIEIALAPEALEAEAPAKRYPVAPRRLRLMAAAVDACLVMSAGTVFALTASAAMGFPVPELHLWKTWLPVLLCVPVLLGAVYLLICYYAGCSTVGMRWMGLRVCGFDGEPTVQELRRRAWASLLSLAVFGIGFGWIFCDHQQLAWHDYISRTFVARIGSIMAL